MKLSDKFLSTFKSTKHLDLSTQDLMDHLDHSGGPLTCLLLAFPFLLPIPIPGLSILFGIIIFILSLGIIFNIKIKIPAFIATRKIPKKILRSILYRLYFLFKKVEPYTYSRFDIVFINQKAVRMTTGGIISVSSFILLLPLPPGTNFPPAIIILLASLGLIKKDGVLLLLAGIIFFIKIIILIYFYKIVLGFIV